MGPIEYLFISIGVIIALIGLARGYHLELGNSVIFMFTIAALAFVDERFEDQIKLIGERIFGVENIDTFMMVIFGGILITVAFASYAGATFAFGTKTPSGLGALLISFGVGLFNGYLLSGSLWYYANLYNYPLVPVQGELSAAATQIVENLLPQTIFDNPVYWLIPATVLMILRVRG